MNNNALIVGVVAVIIIVGALIWSANRASAPVVTTTPITADEEVTFGDPDMDTDMTAMSDMTPSASPMMSPSVSGSPVASPTGTVKEFTVTGSNFKFSPATIAVKKGDTVKVTFVNSAGMHDWKIDEFNAVTKVLQSGQQETVQFVADKTGSFEYYCSVGNHRQMGMKGMLTVE
jgi:plastocyanin